MAKAPIYEMDVDDAPQSPARLLVAMVEANASDEALLEALSDMHEADIAEALDDIEETVGWSRIFRLLGIQRKAEVISELEDEDQEEAIKNLHPDEIARLIDAVEPDEAAGILNGFEEPMRREVLVRLEDDDHAEAIASILGHEEETAGRIMTTEFHAVPATISVGTALEQMRQGIDDVETVHHIFVQGANGKLVGLLDIETLLAADDALAVCAVMDTAIISVLPDVDQEHVARLMEKYDLSILPVVDAGQVLLGIITIDDVLDVIEDEASEDMYRMAGIGADDPFREGAFSRAAKRLPWLTTTLIGGFGLAVIISYFQPTLKQIVALVSFIPVIAGLSGNVGIQSSTVTVRGLATGDVELKDVFWLLRREMAVGAMIGVTYALMLAISAYVFLGSIDPSKAEGITDLLAFCLTLASACFVGIVVAALIGTLAPLGCQWLGFDPAVAAGPFVTVVIDITTQTLYLAIATLYLLHDVPA